MNTVESYISYIRQLHPEITNDHPISLNREGSANIVLIIQSTRPWVFRFPREDNPAAPHQMKREQLLLPKLRDWVPYIPQVTYFSDHPLPYIAYPMIPGKQLLPPLFAQVPLLEKEILGKELAHFLTVLHSFPGASYFSAEEAQRSSLKLKWEHYWNSIRQLVFPQLNEIQRVWTLQLFESFLSNEQHFGFNPCFINGDLKPEHILVDKHTYRLTGVIDLGLMMGDPALDFAYIKLGKPFQSMLLKHYRGIQDETFANRIDFYEKTIPFYALLYGVINAHEGSLKRGIELLDEVIIG
jgi:aminoglycoside 2''-phosphotransferase